MSSLWENAYREGHLLMNACHHRGIFGLTRMGVAGIVVIIVWAIAATLAEIPAGLRRQCTEAKLPHSPIGIEPALLHKLGTAHPLRAMVLRIHIGQAKSSVRKIRRYRHGV